MTNSNRLRLAMCAVLALLLGASSCPAQDIPGVLPLEVPTAGTPEAGVLAGLPMVQRMADGMLLFERRLRTNEAAACRRDQANYERHLRASLAGREDASLVMPLRRSMIGTMNRRATLEYRLQAIDRELARRRR